MKWIGISGSRTTNAEVEKDVREFVRDTIQQEDGIVTGGALGVDYFATDEVLKLDPRATHVKVFLPATLERYAVHYRNRANEGVITHEQAEQLIAQLTELKNRNPEAVIEDTENEVVNIKNYFDHNTEVVNATDELAAFQVNESKGTQDTIDKARTQSKMVYLKQYSIL
jgi:hypothetical protein